MKLKIKKPSKNIKFYRPLEKPRMYPLELTKDLHICLWDKNGGYKWTVALWHREKEGYSLRFIGDRPLDTRINWNHFKDIVKQGQKIANEIFEEEYQEQIQRKI